MGYKKTAFLGISWMMGLNIFAGALSVIKIAILARLLSPADFGVLGIAMLSLALLELLTETGINVVLIQPGRKLENYLDSAWVISIFRGLFITIVLLILSPFISLFFNSPKALSVLLFLSVVPLLRGFINPAEVIFQKELRFNYEFIFRGLIYALDALIAIIFAIVTRSILSLVWGLIAGIALEIIISHLFIKPKPQFKLDRGYLLEIFHKGKWVTLSGIFNYIAQNADDIFVGKVFGSYMLGIYQLAYKIGTFTITEITNVVNQVFFPLYSKMAEDKNNLKKVFFKSTFILSLVIIPISSIIFIFPKEIILIFLGSKWINAAGILQALVIYGMMRSIVGYPSSLFLALNNQKYVGYMTFLRASVLCITILPLMSLFGVMGAAYAALLSVILETPLVIYLLYKIFKIK